MKYCIKSIATFCIVVIIVWLLLPITESMIEHTSKFSYALFNIKPQVRICIDILITILFILSIIWFASFKKHRIDKPFLQKLLIVDMALVSWWSYERFCNDAISFYSIYNSSVSYVDVFIGLMIILSIIVLVKYNNKSYKSYSSVQDKTYIHDAPKQKLNEDCLLREALVKNLIREIMSLDTEKSSRSLAITSAWGNGKTTFLNFIREQLHNQIEIISITPWCINPGKSITTFFFQEIIKKLGGINYSIAKKIKEYAYLLEAIELEWLAKPVKISDLASMTKSISDKLVELNIKVLIIFDDIDRLSASEIEEVFRIIRGSANFANFIFLSAFDKRYVQAALKSSNPAYNEHYIEKFFESEISLPELRAEKLHEVILKNIMWIEDEDDRESFKSYVATEKFFAGELPVFYPFTNLRSIYRWINGIHARYEILKGECEIEDLADLEMLYLLFPEVYTLLSKDFKRVLYTERYTTNYQLWNSSKTVSRDDDFHQYLNQRKMYDIKEYCKSQFGYDDYKMNDLEAILNRLLPNTGRVNDLSKGFSNPNYTKRYFNGFLESSEISDQQFDELIIKGRGHIKNFIKNDIDSQYSHALFLQCLNKSRSTEKKSDQIIENIIYLALYSSIHYGQIMLSGYDLANLINKLSYNLQLKKAYVRSILSQESFSFSLLVQFSPIHTDGSNALSSIFSKEDNDSIIAEMLAKAIDEKYSFNNIADYYFYSKTKKIETDKESGKRIETYSSLNIKAMNIYKKYLAENFLTHPSHYVWHNHPNEDQVFPSEYFTEFWASWDDFIIYCNELGFHSKLSETDKKILEEYKSFMQQWLESGRKPIAYQFSIINIGNR